MDLKELKMSATKKMKELEKNKKAILTFLAKVDELKEVPKEKKEKAIEKLTAWFDASGLDGILG